MSHKDADARLPKPERRRFLTAAVATGATGILPHASATQAQNDRTPSTRSVISPSARLAAAETGAVSAGPATSGPFASDFMTDVIKSLDIDYVTANPASSLRGLHESLINYGSDVRPKFLTCTHEEASVAIAHGYFKIAGKPLLVLCHGVVGLQHACMAIYNAWCDRVPVVVISGNDLDASKRPPGVPTLHSVQDGNALVRDFTKWDDTPVSLQHFAQSLVRGFKIATTPPYWSVAILLDTVLHVYLVRYPSGLFFPKFILTSPPQGDLGSVREAARLLAIAELSLFVAFFVSRMADVIRLVV